MAAELENVLDEQSTLIQSSGGVFEVEREGELLFSKAALHRFPEDHEVVRIVKNMESGMPLAEAQKEAGQSVRHPSFGEWFAKLLLKGGKVKT